MAAITVQVDLMEEVRHLAEQRRISPEEIFDIALRRYLRDAQEHKIQQEAESFRDMHPELVKQYLGQVVAIHEGQVVDHDADFELLHQRIRQRFGRTAVLLRRVETKPERVLTFHSQHRASFSY